MKDRSRCDVAVVGGGVAGLACALDLARGGVDVRLLDASHRCGGVIRSVNIEGFLAEAGPNSTMEDGGALSALIDSLGLRARVVVASSMSQARFIVRGEALRALPLSPSHLFTSGAVSLRGKLRALMETVIPRGGTADESVADLVRRRFGREIHDYVADPFVSGVYAGDAERLGAADAFPTLVSMESSEGSVLRGFGRRGRARRAEGRDAPRLISFDRGMQALTDAMADALGDHIECGTEVSSLEDEGDAWRVRIDRGGTEGTITCRVVVLAVDATAAARLLRGHVPDEIVDGAALVPYAPVLSVFIGAPRDAIAHTLAGFGFLVPSCERRRILGTVFSSSLFEGRAPAGHVALTAFAGGVRAPEILSLDDDDAVAMVEAELQSLVGLRGKSLVARVQRYSGAIPQYTPGHRRRVTLLREVLDDRRVYIAGAWVGGASVADCVTHAGETAADVRTRVHTTS